MSRFFLRVPVVLIPVTLAVGLAVAGASALGADGLRCPGGRLVGVGDRMLAVRSRCGDPDFADGHVERRTIKRTVYRPGPGIAESVSEEVDVNVDEWTYDFGARRFVYTLVFENGRVAHIVSGSYGNKKND